MDTNPNPEPNKDLENAANAMNEAAIESEAAELKAEEAPAAEPAPETVADATPIVEAPKTEEVTPAATPAPAAEPKKKGGKKGLVIGIAAGAVLVACGGFAIAYTMDNSVENIALSAISDLFNNHAKTITGSFDLTAIESDAQTNKGGMTNCIDGSYGTNCGGGIMPQAENPISRIHVDIKNDTNADNETKTSATFTVTYNEKDYSITVDSVVIKDYTLYVSISNLKEAIKQAMKEVASDSSMSYYSDYVDLYEDLIDKVVGEIDGVWWKISIPDLVDSADQISASDKTKIKEAYSCIVDVANKASKDGGKYADIYKNNAFVSIEKYTGAIKPSAEGDLYAINLDANKFANFANAMTDQVDSYGIGDCVKKLDGVNGVNVSYTKGKVEAKDVEETFKAINKDLVIAIKNGFFSHKLSGFYASQEGPKYRAVLDFKVEDLAGTVAAPTDTKDISDLVKNVTKAYEEWEETATCKYMKKEYPVYYGMYCDTTTNKPLPQYQDNLNNSTVFYTI